MPIKNLSVITNMRVFFLAFYYFLSKLRQRYSHGYLIILIISCAYGSSYLDYILRTPPEFMYPNRPESLAWLPEKILGRGSTNGGYTELAELFLNFGIWGALFVPGIISYYIGCSMKLFVLNEYYLVYSIPFFSILSVYFIGNLYQTFAFYKALVTCYI